MMNVILTKGPSMRIFVYPFEKRESMILRISLALLIALTCAFTPIPGPAATDEQPLPITTTTANVDGLYNKLQLQQLGLNLKAYQLAVKGWKNLKAKGAVTRDILSICDFTQSGNNKRLYIIDLASGTLLFNTLVAHGKNTGEEFAKFFSNEPSSLKSSLGFYTTKEAYIGAHGMALKLAGMEPGFNDNAEERAIVMHGAEYVTDHFIHQWGKLGRSWGCPAVPEQLSATIINTIKNGSCLFIYYPDNKYLASSRILK
jgi:hypothetical protein